MLSLQYRCMCACLVLLMLPFSRVRLWKNKETLEGSGERRGWLGGLSRVGVGETPQIQPFSGAVLSYPLPSVTNLVDVNL